MFVFYFYKTTYFIRSTNNKCVISYQYVNIGFVISINPVELLVPPEKYGANAVVKPPKVVFDVIPLSSIGKIVEGIKLPEGKFEILESI
jgi:hypothetical protein